MLAKRGTCALWNAVTTFFGHKRCCVYYNCVCNYYTEDT